MKKGFLCLVSFVRLQQREKAISAPVRINKSDQYGFITKPETVLGSTNGEGTIFLMQGLATRALGSWYVMTSSKISVIKNSSNEMFLFEKSVDVRTY